MTILNQEIASQQPLFKWYHTYQLFGCLQTSVNRLSVWNPQR